MTKELSFQNKVIMNSVAFLSMHSFIRYILTSDISTKYQWCIRAEMIEEKVEKIAQMRSKTMNAIKYYHDVVEEEENSGSWIDHIMYLWGKATADNVIERRKKHSKAKLENRFRKGIKNMFSFPAASNSRYLSDTRTSHRYKIHSLVNYTTRQFSFEIQPLFTSLSLMIRSILTEYLNLRLSSSMNWLFIVLKAIVKQLQCSSISDGDSSIANTGPR